MELPSLQYQKDQGSLASQFMQTLRLRHSIESAQPRVFMD